MCTTALRPFSVSSSLGGLCLMVATVWRVASKSDKGKRAAKGLMLVIKCSHPHMITVTSPNPWARTNHMASFDHRGAGASSLHVSRGRRAETPGEQHSRLPWEGRRHGWKSMLQAAGVQSWFVSPGRASLHVAGDRPTKWDQSHPGWPRCPELAPVHTGSRWKYVENKYI